MQPAQHVTRAVFYGAQAFSQPIGGLTPITNILLCDDRGDKNTGGGVAAGRHLFVSPAGRPQVYRLQTQVQSSPPGGC